MNIDNGSRSSASGLKLFLTAGLIFLAWVLSDVLLMIFAAVLIAIAYRGSGEWVARHIRISTGAGLAIVAAFLTGVIALAIWWGGTILLDQFGELWNQLTAQIGAIRSRLQTTPWGQRAVDYLGSPRFLSGAETLAGKFAGAALGTFGVVGSILIVVVTSVYLALQPEIYRSGFVRLLPIKYRQRGSEVLSEMGRTMRLWLIGRAVDMLAVIALTFAGLMLLGVPLALMLALVAGLLNFIPYIGAILGAVPAVLVAFGQGPMQALWVSLLFLGIQCIEGYLLAPYIQQRTVRLPPALTIFSQTAFGTLFGLLGFLLAPALAAAILVAVRSVYIHDVLGDHREAPE